MGDPDGARSPRPVGSRPHRPPIQGRRWWWRPPRSSRAPAHHKYSHASPGRGRADAAPSSGTRPRSCPRPPPGQAIDRQHMPPGARGTGPIRPALDDLRCCHLRVGKEPPGSLFAWTVAAQPAQTHRLARNHLFEDRAPPLSRRRSPNVPSDISMAAPVGRLPQVRESYSRRVGQTKNAATVQTFRRPHYMWACPRAEARGAGHPRLSFLQQARSCMAGLRRP